LKDGGSTIWAETINTIRTESPGTTLETLLPDFRGIWENLDRVLATKPEVVSHNLETVRRLTKEVRIQAKYDRSLECLRRINEADLRTKSGIMLGLGETEDDVYEAMADLLEVGVHILTLGQYLQPSRNHHPVVDWITPDQFAKLSEYFGSADFSAWAGKKATIGEGSITIYLELHQTKALVDRLETIIVDNSKDIVLQKLEEKAEKLQAARFNVNPDVGYKDFTVLVSVINADMREALVQSAKQNGLTAASDGYSVELQGKKDQFLSFAMAIEEKNHLIMPDQTEHLSTKFYNQAELEQKNQEHIQRARRAVLPREDRPSAHPIHA
jgi:hypothetical protein